MTIADPYYAKLLRMREALMRAYANSSDLETNFAFLMRYEDAVRFQRAMKQDHEDRRRAINRARLTIREWPDGDDLSPAIDTIDIPPPPGEPPPRGVWGRIFGIKIVITNHEDPEV